MAGLLLGSAHGSWLGRSISVGLVAVGIYMQKPAASGTLQIQVSEVTPEAEVSYVASTYYTFWCLLVSQGSQNAPDKYVARNFNAALIESRLALTGP